MSQVLLPNVLATMIAYGATFATRANVWINVQRSDVHPVSLANKVSAILFAMTKLHARLDFSAMMDTASTDAESLSVLEIIIAKKENAFPSVQRK